jgi:hypothetical protein
VIRGKVGTSTDEDYFSFVAASDKPATFTIPSVPGGLSSLSLELYKEASASSYIGYTSKRAYESLVYTTPANLVAGKTYYVKLYGGGESEDQYVLTITQ